MENTISSFVAHVLVTETTQMGEELGRVRVNYLCADSPEISAECNVIFAETMRRLSIQARVYSEKYGDIIGNAFFTNALHTSDAIVKFFIVGGYR